MKKLAVVLMLLIGISGTACGSDVVPVPEPITSTTHTDSTSRTQQLPVDSTMPKKPAADTTVIPDTTTKTATDTTLPRKKIDTLVTKADTTTAKPPVTPPPAPPPPPPVVPLIPSDTISPTGRTPRLIWTAQRQATWARMKREGHPLFNLLQNNCMAAVNGSPRYGDRGLWCAMLYQITGNVTYARTAWNLFQPAVVTPPPSGNEVREELIENAILFDWLYPALTATERDAAVAGLNGWANYAMAIGTPAYVGGIRLGDGDANVGYYFGLAAIDLATVGQARHVNWLSATQTSGSTVPIGGLDATGADRNSLRNMVAWYVTQNGNGGEWDESSEYNMGTQVLLAMGAEAIRTATGVDHYPEVTAYLANAARGAGYFVTPDLRQSVQWGDVEHPRDFVGMLWKLNTWLGTVSGVAEASGAGAYSKSLVESLFSQYGMTGYGSAEPWARFFLFYNPYAASADWASGPPSRYFPGTGHLYVHSNGALFESRMANRTYEDHDVQYLSDFELYHNGEWTVTHPQGYGGTANHAQGVNGLLLAGLSAMSSRGADATQSGSNWWSVTGSTNGMFYDMPYYDPPPSFVRTASRTVVYLQRSGLDIIVVQDAVDMDDPKALPNFARYRAADAATITGAPSLVQWVMHAPVQPTVNGNTASWRTPGGQTVTLTSLPEVPTAMTTMPELSVLSAQNYQASELTGYQLRDAPASYTGGQIVLRHVIIVGAQQVPVSLSGNTITIGNTTVSIGATVQVTN